MCNYLLALFFAMLLCIASFIFAAKLFTFASIAFCRFFSVPPPRFHCLSALVIYFFLRFGLQIVIILGKAICFVVFLLSLPLYWCSFRAFVFCVLLQLFCIPLSPVFCFFLHRCLFFCLLVAHLCHICSAYPLLPLHTVP